MPEVGVKKQLPEEKIDCIRLSIDHEYLVACDWTIDKHTEGYMFRSFRLKVSFPYLIFSLSLPLARRLFLYITEKQTER